MKRTTTIFILLLASLLVFAGCGKGGRGATGGTPATAGEGTRGTDTGGGQHTQVPLDQFEVGSTVDLHIKNVATMSDFVMRPLNNPTKIQLNVNLEDWGDGAFGGTIRVAYEDEKKYKINEFRAGKDEFDVQHNVWFEDDGDEVFHAFFEDEYGAVILVVDGTTDLGDGIQSGKLSGSIWYKNFQHSDAPNPSYECLPGFGCPDTRCWFIEIGPYECRSFLVNDEIRTTSMVYPNNDFKILASFSQLIREDAFLEE